MHIHRGMCKRLQVTLEVRAVGSQAVVGHPVGVGTKLGSSIRAVNSLNLWVISPDPVFALKPLHWNKVIGALCSRSKTLPFLSKCFYGPEGRV